MIYITGAGGYLGKEVCKKLENQKIIFKACFRNLIDLENIHEVKNKINKNSLIIHLASKLPSEFSDDEFIEEANLEMINNLLSTNPRKIIFSSSMTVYNHAGLDIKENQASNNLKGYAYSKLEGENLLLKHNKKNSILRIPGLFGNDRKSFIVMSYLDRHGVQLGPHGH